MNFYFAILFLVILGLFPFSASASGAEKVLEYCNPLDVPGADPGILKDGDTYYVYQTRHGGKGFEAFASKDLVHWRRKGFCFEKNKDSWGQWDFWAPEVIRHGDKYYLFCAYDLNSIAPLLQELTKQELSLFEPMPQGSYENMFDQLLTRRVP